MKNEGLVDLEYLRKKKRYADFCGTSAFCFIRGNKIIKIYDEKSYMRAIPFDRNSVQDFSMYKDDTIIFPDEYIYENGIKAGEIMDYIKNESIIFSLDDDTLIRPFINNYENSYDDILIYDNILMCDLCSANILYSNELGFHIIDTSEWKYSDNNTSSWNIHRFNNYIIKRFLEYLEIVIEYQGNNAMLCNDLKNNLLKYGTVGKNLCNVLEHNINHKPNVLDFIYAYMDFYQNYYNFGLRSLKDMKDLTKVLRIGSK